MSTFNEPFMEHPTGEFFDALSAIEAAIVRLRSLKNWDRWIEFCGQGQGANADAEVRVRRHEIDVSGISIDLPLVLKVAGLRPGEIDVNVSSNNSLLISGATSCQMARFLDGLLRGQFGIRPFEDEGIMRLGQNGVTGGIAPRETASLPARFEPGGLSRPFAATVSRAKRQKRPAPSSSLWASSP